MINYFTYDYPRARGRRPFSVSTSRWRRCPWTPGASPAAASGSRASEVAPARACQPTNLVFLIDVSGSMNDAEQAAAAQAGAARCSVQQLDAQRPRGHRRLRRIGRRGAAADPAATSAGADPRRPSTGWRPAARPTAARASSWPTSSPQTSFIKGGINRVILATDGDFNVGVTSQSDLDRV